MLFHCRVSKNVFTLLDREIIAYELNMWWRLKCHFHSKGPWVLYLSGTGEAWLPAFLSLEVPHIDIGHVWNPKWVSNLGATKAVIKLTVTLLSDSSTLIRDPVLELMALNTPNIGNIKHLSLLHSFNKYLSHALNVPCVVLGIRTEGAIIKGIFY